MPSLYAEHINRHLVDNGLDSLDKLRHHQTVVDQFKAKVTSEFFDPIGQKHNLHYAMSILFVYEYFIHGPGYRLNRNPFQVSSLPIIESWTSKLAKTDDNAQVGLAKYCFMTMGVFSAEGQASDTVQDNLQGLQKALASLPPESTAVDEFRQLLANATGAQAANAEATPTTGTIFDDTLIDQYNSVSRLVWTKWQTILNDQTPTTFWQTGIRNAQARESSTERPLGPAVGHIAMTATTIVHGPDLESWCAAHNSADYMNSSAPPLKNTVTTLNPLTVWMPGLMPNQYDGVPPPGLTCFIAGTQVRTESGSLPIELLKEGDRICTRVEPKQWGLRSCELVKSPAPSLIYGFNGDPAFFTAGHVFHTTTGLRALRPDIAYAENPWIECGQLSTGNQLLRIGSDNKYEPVLIRSIDSEPTTQEYVYGVHLREGLRSYHANGYLVALNYPEITVSMIAKRLMALSPAARLSILQTMKELQPILQRFGASTILETLSRESESNNLSFGGKVPAARPFLARDLDMPYIMSFPDTSKYGPQLELLHGVLHIDGKFCVRAAFREESLSWSRPMLGGLWEHAHCTFHNHGQQAFGYVVYTTEQEEDTEDSITTKAIAFELTPGTLETVRPSGSALATEPSARLAAMADTVPSTMIATSAMVTTVPSNADVGVTRKSVSFALAYDPSAYDPSGKTKSNPTIPCGNVVLPTKANRYSFAKLAFDDYDQVQKQLAEKAKNDKTHLSSLDLAKFYKHTVRYDSRQVEHHKFELLQAQPLIEASDEFPVWKAANQKDYLEMEPPRKELHYTNIGLDANFVITELFKTIELEKSLPDANGIIAFTGLAKSYSSLSEGNEGASHIVVGTYVKPTTTTSAAASLQAVSAAASSNRTVTSAHSEPHMLTLALATGAVREEKTDRLQALGKIALDLKAVNSNAQTTMSNVMQWHMKAEDRKLFFNAVDKPTGLPAELTTSIEGTEEATWIRDTYANAYICQILTHSDGQIGSEYRFTEQEKKNVNYFWNGNGPNCLAKSTIYKNLERTISRYQIRQMYKVIDKIHKESTGLEYSNSLYDAYTSDLTIGGLANIDPTTGTSLLAKICTIMDALDDGAETERQIDESVNDKKAIRDTNANHLVLAATSYQKGAVWMYQYWGLKTDADRTQMLEDAWLEDTLRNLVEKVLNQDPSVTGPVSQALNDAMKKYAETIEGWGRMSQKQKVQHILLDIGDRVKDMMKVVGKMLGWVEQGAQWVWQQGYQVVAGWFNNGRALGNAVDHVLQENPVGFVKGPLFSSLMFIVGMAAMGVTIWCVSDTWSDASPSDKGLMITIVLASLNQMAEFGVDAVYSIMRYQNGAFSEAAELAIHAKFDQIARRNLGSKWAAVLEDPLVTGVYRIREAERAENIAALVAGAEESAENNLAKDVAVSELKKLAPIKKSFNIVRSVIAIIGCVISIGIAIFMTWSLIHDWDKMGPTSRIFHTILTVLQCIEAAVALVVIGVGGISVFCYRTGTRSPANETFQGYITWGTAILVGATTTTAIGTFAVAAASVFAAVALVIAVYVQVPTRRSALAKVLSTGTGFRFPFWLYGSLWN